MHSSLALTVAPDENEWSSSHSSHYTSVEIAPGTQWICQSAHHRDEHQLVSHLASSLAIIPTETPQLHTYGKIKNNVSL
jgi:hypothetical protein